MIVVAGTFEFDADHQEAIVAAASVMREATLREAGCITYEFFRDLTADGRLAVIEEWETADHLAAHFDTDHMAVTIESFRLHRWQQIPIVEIRA